MKSKSAAIIASIVLVLTTLLATSLCLAGVRWTGNGVVVCKAANDQISPNIETDGSGGGIIVWADYRSGTNDDIYAQRINSSGVPQWAEGGVAVCTAANNQWYPQIVSDGAGGAIITWQDVRGADWDIYAQRINSSGVPQWTANGVAVCTISNNQQLPQLTADGSGGAIITWRDYRSGTNDDIYAQRINSSGVPQWTANGVAICTAANTQETPQIATDASGGAIITWRDYRSGTNDDIYAQRINSSGVPQWTANGVAVCTASNTQASPRIIPDASGGTIIVWEDLRGSNYDIYAQRVSSTGTAQWTANGVVVCAAASLQDAPRITTDGSGGAIITWRDYRSGTNDDIYAQRINSSGVPQWTANGVAICTAANDQWDSGITTDGSGGAIVAWYDFRSGANGDCYAQRVNSLGVPQWTADGMAVSVMENGQKSPRLIPDGLGGAIITWYDERSGADADIYAQRVSNPAPTVNAINPGSGQNNGTVHVTDLSGTWFSNTGGSPEVHLRRSGQADIVATGVSVVSENKITCDFNLTGAQAGSWNVVVKNPDGQEGVLEGAFTVKQPATTWYLAEGSTAGGMETWVLVQNPNPDPVTVSLTLMTDNGPQNPGLLQNQTVKGNSRTTFPIHDYVSTFNVSTKVEASGDVICERAMYGPGRVWAHDSVGYSH